MEIKRRCSQTHFKAMEVWDAWVAQSAECLILDLGSGYDHRDMIPGSQERAPCPAVCLAWSLLKMLSLPLAPLLLTCTCTCAGSLSRALKIKKKKNHKAIVV